jgi:penicillin-binding protein 2
MQNGRRNEMSAASPILRAILTASLQGAAVTLLLLALRPWLVRTVPARWRSFLWLVVWLRLLIPSVVLPPNPVSLQNIPLFDRPDGDILMLFGKVSPEVAVAEGRDFANSHLSAGRVPSSFAAVRAAWHMPSWPWWQIAATIWGAGAMLMACWFLTAAIRLRKRLHRSRPLADVNVAASWAQACRRFSIRRPPRLLVMETEDSPALVGIFAPVLLLPMSAVEQFSPEDWEHVFLHELAHFRRRDHWAQVLQLLVLCVHWFNPLVWWGIRFQRADRESAADDMALTHLPAGSASRYGGTLLKVLSAHSAGGFQMGMIGIMEEIDDLKQRLRGIMDFQRRRVLGSAMGMTLLIGLAVVVFGRAAGDDPASESPVPTATSGRLTVIATGDGGEPNTYRVLVPAERGQILDRHGNVLATNRVVQHLGIIIPPMPEAEVGAFVREQVDAVGTMLSQPLKVPSDKTIHGHYQYERPLPLDILKDLTDEQQALAKAAGRSALAIHAVPLRYYPNGQLGAHFLGFTGSATLRKGDAEPEGLTVIDGTEGREGLEHAFDAELAGKPGTQLVRLDAATGKTAQKWLEEPRAGRSVVTTIDAQLQTWCESALQEQTRRGAMVVLDPNTGEVLALASWPSFNPNRFIPAVSAAYFHSLNEDSSRPLVDRATHGLYPPGGVFKIFSGLAAIESGAVKLDEKIGSPSEVQLGDYTFRDWKNVDRGELTFPEALAQNADTWFYQVGVRTGAEPILDWASKFGFGRKTGVSLRGEISGVLPTDEYLRTKSSKDWKALGAPGLANLAVGQGYVVATPLEMARAMATLASGGSIYQLQLAKQLKDASGKVIGEYPPKREARLEIRQEVLETIRKAMVAAVNGEEGSGRAASVEGVQVAGQTASSSAIAGGAELIYGWFAGFAPAEHPQYAFACICEGDKDHKVSGEATAAPVVGKVLRKIFRRPQ